MLPVYILIRTSNRPQYFARMMETIKRQTYKNIVTIVHSDDPRDTYVTGDIIINGTAFGPEYGNGTYNLYNNRLLKAIPDGPGWYCFIDDDDEYASDDVIERLVENAKRDHINVGRVIRWNGVVFPAKWGVQKSFQTEIFFLHTDHKHRAKWWANKGGDHYYTKQLTRVLPINWIEDLYICRAQEGKGHGRQLDRGGKPVDLKGAYPDNQPVVCLGTGVYRRGTPQQHIRVGELKRLPYGLAYQLEQKGLVKITNWTTFREKIPVRVNDFLNFK